MAKFSLHIETSDANELAEIALRIAVGSGGAVGTAAGETPSAEFHGSGSQLDEPKATPAPAADKPRRGRPAKVEAAPAVAAVEPAPVAEPAPAAPVAAPAPAPAPAAPAAAPAGEITYDTLKETLTQVLGVKSAKDAQDVIREATGGRAASLTQCQVEDYPVVVAALRAVLQ
jgi:pyruvate dehydrogenase E2 component (dihydrolipoamide acetyltransferase)